MAQKRANKTQSSKAAEMIAKNTLGQFTTAENFVLTNKDGESVTISAPKGAYMVQNLLDTKQVDIALDIKGINAEWSALMKAEGSLFNRAKFFAKHRKELSKHFAAFRISGLDSNLNPIGVAKGTKEKRLVELVANLIVDFVNKELHPSLKKTVVGEDGVSTNQFGWWSVVYDKVYDPVENKMKNGLNGRLEWHEIKQNAWSINNLRRILVENAKAKQLK